MTCCTSSVGSSVCPSTCPGCLTSGDPEPLIPYPWLADLVLNYKLGQHVQFLAKFREKFRRIDRQNKGYIPSAKLSALLEALDPTDVYDHAKTLKESAKLPKGRLSFTDVVGLVAAAEPVAGEVTQSLLEAVSME